MQAHNWFGNIVSHPSVVVEPCNVEELVAIVRDTTQYPSPVRAVGSNHSTTPCAVADGGTIVSTRRMNRILRIGRDAVTAQAGALYIDVAKALQRHQLQFFVNTEIGNLTMGSAACCETKDASMPGEAGQVNSYVIGMKLVTPAGEIIEITEKDPELLRVARSSYGLLGIVYEVTIRVRPLAYMTLEHRSYTLEGFVRDLPALQESDASMMLYLAPFLGRVIVELRRYHENVDRSPRTIWQWRLRNYVWKTISPGLAYLVRTRVPFAALRNWILDTYYRTLDLISLHFMQATNTAPPDQMIRYADQSDNTRYTFSIWAFQEADYPAVLRAYFQFCRDYYQATGYRCDLLSVGYRISQNDSSLLSYSSRGNVMTADPVSTGGPGWDDFLLAYNEFCERHHGVPLFNQSPALTRQQVEHAFGARLDTFRQYRQHFDPTDRLLNGFFRELLGTPTNHPEGEQLFEPSSEHLINVGLTYGKS